MTAAATTADRNHTAFVGPPKALGDLAFTGAWTRICDDAMTGRDGTKLILLIAAKAP